VQRKLGTCSSFLLNDNAGFGLIDLTLYQRRYGRKQESQRFVARWRVVVESQPYWAGIGKGWTAPQSALLKTDVDSLFHSVATGAVPTKWILPVA
jgi:hypothetical protein